MVQLSSHVNPGNYILEEKFCNSAKNDTAIEKKAVYIEVKLQNWIQGCKLKLLSINTSRLIVNQVFCVIVKLKLDY